MHATGSITEAIVLEQPVQFGDPITVHVHNHGVNTWAILEMLAQ